MKICVIGAGAAGIITASSILHHYHENNNNNNQQEFHLTILERSSSFCGIFNADRISSSQNKTPVYPFLRSNLPTMLMENPLLSWSDAQGSSITYQKDKNHESISDESEFPSWKEMSKYLMALTRKFELEKYTRFHSNVESVTENNKNTVEVVTVSSSEETTEKQQREKLIFDLVIICTGRFHTPKIPSSLSSSCSPSTVIIHSANINWSTFVQDFSTNKSVALIGAGSSARDILLQLLAVAKCRKVTWVNKRIFQKFGPRMKSILESIAEGNGIELIFVEQNIIADDEVTKKLLEHHDVIICATGFESNETNNITVSSSKDSRSLISYVGQRGFVAPLAMLYYEAQDWIKRNLVTDYYCENNNTHCHNTFRKNHPEDIPGELPFTAFSDSIDSSPEQLDLLHFKQYLFEIAEKRLCEDFTTYREVKYRGNEELMEMVKEEVKHCV